MNREEANSRFKDVIDKIANGYTSADVLLIDKIFDDIESRVCENCKYWNEYGRCTNSQVIVYLNGEQPFTFALFGCNQFNRKENI